MGVEGGREAGRVMGGGGMGRACHIYPHTLSLHPTDLRGVALEHALPDREGLVRVEHLADVHRLPLELLGCVWCGGVEWV